MPTADEWHKEVRYRLAQAIKDLRSFDRAGYGPDYNADRAWLEGRKIELAELLAWANNN